MGKIRIRSQIKIGYFHHFRDFQTLRTTSSLDRTNPIQKFEKFEKFENILKLGDLYVYFFYKSWCFLSTKKILKNYLITLLIKLLLYCQGSFYIIFYYQDEPMLYLSSLYKPLLNLFAEGQISAQEVKASF